MFIKSKELATIKWNKRFWEINWYAIHKAVDECVADGSIDPEIRKKIIDRASDITLELFGLISKNQD